MWSETIPGSAGWNMVDGLFTGYTHHIYSEFGLWLQALLLVGKLCRCIARICRWGTVQTGYLDDS